MDHRRGMENFQVALEFAQNFACDQAITEIHHPVPGTNQALRCQTAMTATTRNFMPGTLPQAAGSPDRRCDGVGINVMPQYARSTLSASI
nr:hypothetical protein [uncultured Noviherbaspirillum sp.]